MATLLHGTETWTVEARQVHQLEVFGRILIVTWLQQWKGHITSSNLKVEFDMPDRINVLVIQCRLQWLGRVGRMSDHLPKRLLIGEPVAARPAKL